MIKKDIVRKPRVTQRTVKKEGPLASINVYENGPVLKYMPKRFGKTKVRKGRGTGSGHGNMSTRGSKGQGRSSGTAGAKPGFEGGQTPWYKRVPKRGFTPYSKYDTLAIRLNRLVEEMQSKKMEKVKIQDIFDMFDAPFYYKKIRIFGEIESIPMNIDVECHNISEGAKISISRNKGHYREIKPKSHSYEKKTYNSDDSQYTN